MNIIAAKTGIEGIGEAIVEAVYEDVNISMMEMSENPVIMKMKVGYLVQKRGAFLQEDGKMKPSGLRIGMRNAWEKCCKSWAKEEMYTEGYTKKSQYPPKYNTKYKRRYHFQSEIDNALGIADSVAWSKCIRELTGMQTGYSTEDLKEGKFYFAKIRRSKLAIKAESAARLSAISKGINAEKTSLLFGTTEQKEVVPDPVPVPESEPNFPKIEFFEPKVESVKTRREQFIDLIEGYQAQNLVPNDAQEPIDAILKWLKESSEAEKNIKYWERAIGIMETLEKVIPEVGRIEHSLF